jgi:hypothetical protein
MQKLLKRALESTRWFNGALGKLEDAPRFIRTDFEIIIVQAIVRYLNESIDFSMFMEIIERMKTIPKTKTIPPVNEVLTQLSSLSKYSSHPQANREKIVDVIKNVVEKINK